MRGISIITCVRACACIWAQDRQDGWQARGRAPSRGWGVVGNKRRFDSGYPTTTGFNLERTSGIPIATSLYPVQKCLHKLGAIQQYLREPESGRIQADLKSGSSVPIEDSGGIYSVLSRVVILQLTQTNITRVRGR